MDRNDIGWMRASCLSEVVSMCRAADLWKIVMALLFLLRADGLIVKLEDEPLSPRDGGLV